VLTEPSLILARVLFYGYVVTRIILFMAGRTLLFALGVV